MSRSPLQIKLHDIIFGTDTPMGKLFDMVLIYVILFSVVALMLDSIGGLSSSFGFQFMVAEWFFTILFTIEYIVRLYCSPAPIRYARSFYGIVDLLAILPTYLSVLVPGANYLLIVRMFRVLRIFKVLKLVGYISEANVLIRSMINSRRKIFVFFCFVLVISMVFGSIMYIVEGPENGFSSIPKSIYWMIVTITTVGYGDITPQTVLGQIVASIAMLTGYSIIAVPTGILTAELTREIHKEKMAKSCATCDRFGHEIDAHFCKYCGVKLPEPSKPVS